MTDMLTRADRAFAMLAQWNLSASDLVSAVGPLTDRQALLLVGSYATGHANAYSDIDLLVLGGPRPVLQDDRTDFGARGSVFRLTNGREIEVNHRTTSDLEILGHKMDACHELMFNPQSVKIPKLEMGEYALIHQVRVGICLAGADGAEHYRALLRVDDLHYHAVVRRLVTHYVLREDAIAQIKDGDATTAFWMLRAAIASLAEAEIASAGETHYRREWLLRHLKRNIDIIGSDAVEIYLDNQQRWPDELSELQFRSLISFCDQRVMDILGRKQELVPLILSLGQKAATVTALD